MADHADAHDLICLHQNGTLHYEHLPSNILPGNMSEFRQYSHGSWYKKRKRKKNCEGGEN